CGSCPVECPDRCDCVPAPGGIATECNCYFCAVSCGSGCFCSPTKAGGECTCPPPSPTPAAERCPPPGQPLPGGSDFRSIVERECCRSSNFDACEA
ncbi:unnamed protein product, partial [Ostreobium quekettii]